MKPLKIIVFLLLFYQGFRMEAQTTGDSSNLTTSHDSLMNEVQTKPLDPLPYKTKYRHGIQYIVTTNTGGIYTGFVISETATNLQLENRRTQEVVDLLQSEIKSIRPMSVSNGLTALVGENHHARRYMFASSAFLFEPQQLSSTYHLFILADLDYSITENWAVSAHSIAFYPISIGAKCAFKLDESNYVGGGLFGFANISNSSNNAFFLGYGGIAKYTSGTSNRNFTLAGGVLAINSDVVFTSRPAHSAQFLNLFFSNLSYCSRLSERVALNLEGWYFPQAAIGIAGAGVKLVKHKESSWTFGCYTFLNLTANTIKIDYKVLPIPYVGLNQKF